QVDFVSATHGLRTDSYLLKPVLVLKRWATTSEDLPHLIVMGHGIWTFFTSYHMKHPFLDPYDEILENWKQTADFLVNLAARTNVLVWPQGRKSMKVLKTVG
ncbi:unnamed protein product, partial [Meganyctiphanes norvegica]